MEQILSKSEKKRRANSIEDLALELGNLSPHEIKSIPCSEELRQEIGAVKELKGGARKRQVKYIAKLIRQESIEELLDFMERYKGSRLKSSREFNEIERLRDDIMNEAIARHQETRHNREADEVSEQVPFLESQVLLLVREKFPGLDLASLQKSAGSFARTRRPVYSREVFRLLKAATDSAKLPEQK